MGNAVKGQVTFEASGETWTLEFTPNGFCALEDETGQPTMTFLDNLNTMVEQDAVEIRAVRQLFWAGLVEHAPDVTLMKAGSLMRDVGGIEGALDLAGRAVQLGFTAPDKPDKPGTTKKKKTPPRK